MPRVFASLDALVFPSVWEETSGIGAREALAAGVPVIASRIGGIPETVRHGTNGLLFEPGDPADLARQIRRLIEEPDLLDHLRAGCRVPRTLDDDVAATRDRYLDLVRRSTTGRVAHSSHTQAATVAAVVLNYRTPDQTAVAAEMLSRSNTRVAPLVVVDNGDGVECRAALAAFGGDVTLVTTGANLGFSGGCNAGIREAMKAGATSVLLVNSDVIVPPDCLPRLIAALGRQSRPGIVAPLVRSRVWPDQVLSAGIDYDPGTGRMRHRVVPHAGGVTDAVSGCAMLVHRSVFDTIGLLPEEYFFSFEDIAFCLRARAEGFDVGLEPGATVYHEGSGTMGASPRRLYYAARNHLRLGAETPARTSWHRRGRQCAIAAYNIAHAMTASGGTAPTRILAVVRGYRPPPARALRRRLNVTGGCDPARDDPDQGHARDRFEWAHQVEPAAAGRDAIERPLDQRTGQERDQCRHGHGATYPPVRQHGSVSGARRPRTTTTTPRAAPTALSTMSFQSRYPGTARGRVCHCQISSRAPSAVAVSQDCSSPSPARTSSQAISAYCG